MTEIERCTLDDAFAELSASAFAVWVRLMSMDDSLLGGGVGNLARELGQPVRTFDRRLHELHDRAYLRLDMPGGGRRTEVTIVRRAVFARWPDAFFAM